jgi:hypothetical protein
VNDRHVPLGSAEFSRRGADIGASAGSTLVLICAANGRTNHGLVSGVALDRDYDTVGQLAHGRSETRSGEQLRASAEGDAALCGGAFDEFDRGARLVSGEMLDDDGGVFA